MGKQDVLFVSNTQNTEPSFIILEEFYLLVQLRDFSVGVGILCRGECGIVYKNMHSSRLFMQYPKDYWFLLPECGCS